MNDESNGNPASSTASAYDRVAYLTEPTPRTNPFHLAGLSALYNITPPPPGNSQILEIGCGSGANLISLAAANPSATVTGIDLSQSAISEAQVTAAELGLKNISFQQIDLVEFSQSDRTFDYIIAHGLYSWVPPEIQTAVLQLIKKQLTPTGVAFISFNTLPGWYMRGMFREIALFHIRDTNDPVERLRLTRGILGGIQKFGRSEDGFDIGLLRRELEQMLNMPDWYLFHDLLEQHNHPCYFAEFIEKIHAHQLRYVADAEPQKNEPLEFSDEARRFITAITDERYGFEQYTDFFRMRMFRRAIICHEEVELSLPDPGRIANGGLYIAAFLRRQPGQSANDPVKYVASNGGALVIGQRWLQAILQQLIDAWPNSLPVADLLAAVDYNPELRNQAAKTLLEGFFAGVIEITTEPVPVARTTENPRVFPPARLFSHRGQSRVGNVRHEMVQLPPAVAAILPLLDGSKDPTALEAGFSAFRPLLSPKDAQEFSTLGQVLDFLRQNSLLF